MIAPDQGPAAIEISHAAGKPGQPVTIMASRDWRGRLTLAGADLAETLRLWPLVWTLLSLIHISNPGYAFTHTRFPSVRLKPLGHLSRAEACIAKPGG